MQAARNKQFVNQLARELKVLAKKGRLRHDVDESPDVKSALQELLTAFEDPPVDDAKFEALKKIFLAACAGDTSTNVLQQLILAVARRLSAGELVVPATAHKVGRNAPSTSTRSVIDAKTWLSEIATALGLGSTDFVE
ncbi:hypothetical protein [Candidatus Nitrospira inopinata]|uniref:Uncharacterized protein n=1 Tax=Candidatus Nitrospira inopinata TaxID=1715989 RepID=A0A0S4KVC0_9BACT|nr:hypothetical protein [Candidatus Nitrospira inopinata]CUQ67743.1 protein of unknown function [Candidatus Nitrospira inopinata]